MEGDFVYAPLVQQPAPRPTTTLPKPGSPEEEALFALLQARLPDLFATVFPDPNEPRSVVVVPSLSMDPEVLTKIEGAYYYEERMLFMLMLLQLPHTHLIYITSQPIAPTVVDYYLHLLPGIPVSHARRRLTMLSCFDGTPVPLTQKILERPRLMRRILASIPNRSTAHLTCFNTTPLERTLAVRLGMPLYANDPAHNHLGTKTGSRTIFKEAGVRCPDGFEQLRDMADVAEALAALKTRNPDLRRAVVKLEEGFSGEGNALFIYDADAGCSKRAIQAQLPARLRFEAKDMTYDRYATKYQEMGGITEAFVEGAVKRSPSVQCRVDPLGNSQLISTHDQVLGGPSGQIFLGCSFPADLAYAGAIQERGVRIADTLRDYGALGRFGVDYISVLEDDTWQHYAIEINLRKGGTTHPYLMLQFLTDGTYDTDTATYYTPTGRPRYYYASDNLQRAQYKGLLPSDLIDIAVDHRLHFHAATQQGVVFHLIGALSEFGKLGVLCIADSHARARSLYDQTITILDQETQTYQNQPL